MGIYVQAISRGVRPLNAAGLPPLAFRLSHAVRFTMDANKDVILLLRLPPFDLFVFKGKPRGIQPFLGVPVFCE